MKRNIYIMYIISLLQGMVFYAPVATLYRTAQGLSVFEIALTESVFFILCILMEIPWGIFADKIGYKKTLNFCCGLYVVSKLIFWQATGFGWFLLERVLLGIVFAGLSGVDVSILYLSCEDGKSQKVFGIYNALGTIGLLFSAAVYSIWIQENYKLAGALTVISYGLALLFSLGLKEVKKKDSHKFDFGETRKIVHNILKNRKLILFLIAIGLVSETFHMVTVFLNQVQYERCGLSEAIIGYVYIVATIVSLCSVFSAWFTKKLGEKAGSILLFIVSATACLILSLTGRAAMSVICILVLQALNGIFQPLQLEIQNKYVETKDRATALSINAMLVDCICIVINMIYGYVAKNNISIAFFVGFFLCMGGLFLFVLSGQE